MEFGGFWGYKPKQTANNKKSKQVWQSWWRKRFRSRGEDD